jgi:PAS domain S-box-containing protein
LGSSAHRVPVPANIHADDQLFSANRYVQMAQSPNISYIVLVDPRDYEKLPTREDMLRTEHNAIQNAANGIAIVDMNAEFEYVNPAVAGMWGYGSIDEVLGMNVGELFDDVDAVQSMATKLMEGEKHWVGELVACHKDQTTFSVQVSASCNRNAEGVPVGIVFSFVDISDRRRAEQAEREAERQRVMLESLGAACHHLGQPATVLLANLGIIHKKLDSDDEIVNELMTTSITAAETLGEILHKLNTVNEYKTTQYLEKREGSDSPENRILDI